jgi:hypothetical protein
VDALGKPAALFSSSGQGNSSRMKRVPRQAVKMLQIFLIVF